jgi:hypothetical protein
MLKSLGTRSFYYLPGKMLDDRGCADVRKLTWEDEISDGVAARLFALCQIISYQKHSYHKVVNSLENIRKAFEKPRCREEVSQDAHARSDMHNPRLDEVALVVFLDRPVVFLVVHEKSSHFLRRLKALCSLGGKKRWLAKMSATQPER